MILLSQYFIGRPHTPVMEEAAKELLERVNALIDDYRQSTGKDVPINPHTGSMISGRTEGGFRLPDCAQGASFSSHKEAKGVDIYDPNNELDNWITQKILKKHDLYREHPSQTLTWLHLSTRPPKSGCRTFIA